MTDEPAPPGADDPACVEEVEIMTDYLEGALPPAAARRLERHLERCRGCSEYLAQLRMVAASLRGLRSDALSPELRDELIAVFRELRRHP